MASGFGNGGRRPRDWEAGVILIQAVGDRVASVRRRLLLGEYDHDYVISEVARRILACGALAGRKHREKAMPPPLN